MRGRRLATAAAAAVALACPGARGEGPPEAAHETVQIGLRSLGWSVPMGKMSENGRPVTQAIKGAFPLILDLGGKISRRFFVGAYLGFNPGIEGSIFKDLCRGDVTCTANNVRVGLQVQLHLRPAARINPWVGLGVGSEATTITAESRIGNYTQTRGGTSSFQGIELMHLVLGADYRAHEVWGFGPFVAFTLGRYQTTTARNVLGNNKTNAIDLPANHQWLIAGVRVVIFP